eukprot:103744_1
MIGAFVIKTCDGRIQEKEPTSQFKSPPTPRNEMSTNGGEDLERMVDERGEGKPLKFSSNWMYCKRNGQNMNHSLDICNGGVFAVMDDCNNMILLLLDYAHVDRDSDYNGNGSSNEGIEEVMYSAYGSPPLKRVYVNVIQWIEVKSLDLVEQCMCLLKRDDHLVELY